MKKVFLFLGAVLTASSAFADFQMNCVDQKSKSPQRIVLAASASETPSRRLTSNLQESRSATDSETLPQFLIAQYIANPANIYILLDNADVDGALVGELFLSDIAKKKGDKAIWRYQGTYKRFDAGRQLNLKVECAITK